MSWRPSNFQLDFTNPLASGLVFAGLGASPGAVTMFDSSSYYNNGTLTNMAPSSDWVPVPELKRFGTAVVASNQENIVRANMPSLNPATVSLSVWFKTPGMATASQYGLLTKLYTAYSAPYYQYTLGWYGSTHGTIPNQIAFRCAAGESHTALTSAGTAVIVNDTWIHLCGTYDGAAQRIYANGTLIASQAASGTITAYDTPMGVAGPNPYNFGGILLSTGTIADPLIYNRGLTPAEVADLADPSNVYLSGLIAGRPRRRYLLPNEAPATSIPKIVHHRRLMGVA